MAKPKKHMLELIDKHAQLGKIGYNIEQDKESSQDIPEFKIPVELLLEQKEAGKLMGDQAFVAAFFEKRDGVWELSQGAAKCSPLVLNDNFEGATVVMTLDDGEDEEFEECLLTRITLEPVIGGKFSLKFSLYVQPGFGETNLRIQKHQHREVMLTITNAVMGSRAKGKQGDLPLGDPDAEYEGGQVEPPPRGGRADPAARKKRATKKLSGKDAAAGGDDNEGGDE